MLTVAESRRAVWAGIAIMSLPPVDAADGALSRSVASRQASGWISDRTRVNGVLLEWRSTTLTGEPSVLADRVSTLWRVGEPGGAIRTADAQRPADTTVIGRQRGAHHEVIRFETAGAGRTRVLVSAVDLSQPVRPVPAPPFSLPSGQRLLAVLEPGDAGSSQTFVLQASSGGARTAWQFVQSLRQSGWVVQIGRDGPTGKVHWAVRAGQRLEAVVIPEGRTTRIVAQVTTDAAR